MAAEGSCAVSFLSLPKRFGSASVYAVHDVTRKSHQVANFWRYTLYKPYSLKISPNICLSTNATSKTACTEYLSIFRSPTFPYLSALAPSPTVPTFRALAEIKWVSIFRGGAL